MTFLSPSLHAPETVYFDESVKSAKVVVDACISKWEALLKSLPEDERAKLQRSMGLRMEQLKVRKVVDAGLISRTFEDF